MLDYYRKDSLTDNSMEKRIQENDIRKQTLDEVSMKCRTLAENGEVTYFSIEDIDRVIEELKKQEK